MQIPVFLINRDARPDRLAKMRERLGDLPFTRFPAVERGVGLSDAEIERIERELSVCLSTVACGKSHLAIYRRILDEDLPWACILEDDAVLSDDFAARIRQPDWLPAEFGVIRLESSNARPHQYRRGVSIELPKLDGHPDRRLLQLEDDPGGTAAYLISRRACRELLDFESPAGRRPLIQSISIDHFLFGEARPHITHGCLQVAPAMVIQETELTGDYAESDSYEDRKRQKQRRKQRDRGAAARLAKFARGLPGRKALAALLGGYQRVRTPFER